MWDDGRLFEWTLALVGAGIAGAFGIVLRMRDRISKLEILQEQLVIDMDRSTRSIAEIHEELMKLKLSFESVNDKQDIVLGKLGTIERSFKL